MEPPERLVFAEERAPTHYLKVIVSGQIDETLLDALESFAKRQRKRIAKAEGREPGEAA